MKRFLLLFCLSCTGVLAAEDDIVSVQKRVAPAFIQLISAANEIELLSLDPLGKRDEGGNKIEPPADKNFHGWLITGQATTRNRAEISALAESLRVGMEESSGYPAFCFNPRHALRIKRTEGDIGVIVCFECLSGYVHGFAPLPAFLTTAIPGRQWDAIFEKHGLRKAK